MRETLQQAAKNLLNEPVGTERTITININDGLTGLAPGGSARDARTKSTKVRVDAQSRPDGKKRTAVVSEKGEVLAASTWKALA